MIQAAIRPLVRRARSAAAAACLGLVGVSGTACTPTNPREPGATSGGPATGTTDRGERMFGAEPMGGLTVETAPDVSPAPAR